MPIPRAYRNDPNAPWNDPPNPECPDCDETILEPEDHAEWCPCEMDAQELHEYYAEEAQHTEYDPVEHKDL
jgi:hypothetical protein